MEKNLNKIEEMNEEVKVEELTEETLDTVDGGVIVILGVTLTTAQAIGLGAASLGAVALGVWNGYCSK